MDYMDREMRDYISKIDILKFKLLPKKVRKKKNED